MDAAAGGWGYEPAPAAADFYAGDGCGGAGGEGGDVAHLHDGVSPGGEQDDMIALFGAGACARATASAHTCAGGRGVRRRRAAGPTGGVCVARPPAQAASSTAAAAALTVRRASTAIRSRRAALPRTRMWAAQRACGAVLALLTRLTAPQETCGNSTGGAGSESGPATAQQRDKTHPFEYWHAEEERELFHLLQARAPPPPPPRVPPPPHAPPTPSLCLQLLS